MPSNPPHALSRHDQSGGAISGLQFMVEDQKGAVTGIPPLKREPSLRSERGHCLRFYAEKLIDSTALMSRGGCLHLRAGSFGIA